MKTTSIILIVIISLFLSLVFLLNYQYLYDDYNIYAFKPKNAPPESEKLNETITNNTNKQQQQQTQITSDKDSLDLKTKSFDECNPDYPCITIVQKLENTINECNPDYPCSNEFYLK